MQEGRPSRTAWRVALRRAAHQRLDHPTVFDDPVALRILGPEAEARLLDGSRDETTPFARALRAFLAARSRHAEDRLRAAIERGIGQYVVLGAGLDTFACRNPDADRLRVFEVDHPATQAWKRGLLAEAGIDVPASLTFAPVDFERQTLARGLADAGFESAEPAFFSWLGVTPYLTREAIFETLRFVAASPAGSEIVFDYGMSPELLGPLERRALAALAGRVEAAGEPFRTFFDPVELARELNALGFGEIEDSGSEAINARYFAGRSDGLRVGGGGRLMRATVGAAGLIQNRRDEGKLMKILLFGATGSAGGSVLRACLSSPRVSEVRTIARRPLDLRDGKLRAFVHGDYQDYSAVREAFSGIDACLFCLGISVTQVSGEDEYRRITRDFAVAAARELAAASPSATFVYLSGQGAGLESRMMWARVKAEAERELIEGFEAVCFRPAAIDGEPSASAPRIYGLVRPLFALLRPFRGLYIEGQDLGRAMLQAVAENCRGEILENRQIRDLADRARV